MGLKITDIMPKPRYLAYCKRCGYNLAKQQVTIRSSECNCPKYIPIDVVVFDTWNNCFVTEISLNDED